MQSPVLLKKSYTSILSIVSGIYVLIGMPIAFMLIIKYKNMQKLKYQFINHCKPVHLLSGF
jgi:hypothetical protein